MRVMIRTIEAIVDGEGNVKLLEPHRASAARRALVMILDESPSGNAAESALLSESALAMDWDRPEEDEAWEHLQRPR